MVLQIVEVEEEDMGKELMVVENYWLLLLFEFDLWDAMAALINRRSFGA